ncbi:response regulator [Paraburkholderia hospita]|uniref:response regulator n=1 Tax=Paraburkholderia hospita TaxID=169430 RepID=UPI000B3464F0|nr:response regulator [Paraburkholderia hospita]OUL97374.1 response regulator [Paraburkholderia hospita]
MNVSSRSTDERPAILLVDDAIDALEAWALLLRMEGFEVVTATGGQDAWHKAQQSPPALVITDLMMPGMNGLALCRALKADSRLEFIPIILWTAATISVSEPVFDRFLVKPVLLDTLLEHINGLLVGP